VEPSQTNTERCSLVLKLYKQDFLPSTGGAGCTKAERIGRDEDREAAPPCACLPLPLSLALAFPLPCSTLPLPIHALPRRP